MLAGSKLNSIENKISKSLIDNEISHKDVMTILDEKKNIDNWNEALEWWIIKEVMPRKLIWLKKEKKYVLMKSKCNEVINNSLKYKYV